MNCALGRCQALLVQKCPSDATVHMTLKAMVFNSAETP